MRHHPSSSNKCIKRNARLSAAIRKPGPCPVDVKVIDVSYHNGTIDWEKVKAAGLTPVLVTGSGQRTLLDRLDRQYPGIFAPGRMVTAFDVKHGKPDPEPYLMGLQKAGVQACEAVVVENAPIGVQAGHAAGIFTIAVNTGPLDGQVLLDAGADLLFPSMQALCHEWEDFVQATTIELSTHRDRAIDESR